MTTHNIDHDKYKEKIKTLFNNAGFVCIDEDQNGKNTEKTPDLKCQNEKLIIEVKIFYGGNEDRRREEISKKQIKERASYWIAEKHSTFADHLKRAKKKFRNYPDYKSMVVFIDLMPLDDQHIEELFFKDEYSIQTTDYSNSRDVSSQILPKPSNRVFSKNNNCEIGAVAQFYPKDNRLLIIHNAQADAHRRVPYCIGKSLKAKQKIYIDDSINPRIKKYTE